MAIAITGYPSNIYAGIPSATMTLDRQLLVNQLGVTDSHWLNNRSIRRVQFIYEGLQGQRETLTFVGANTAKIELSEYALDSSWRLQTILVQDFDNGTIRKIRSSNPSYFAQYDLNVIGFAGFNAALLALLQKLDADNGVSDTDYASTLAPTVADSLGSPPPFNSLLAKLDLDGGVSDTNYSSLHASPVPNLIYDLANKFNSVLEKLDQDNGVSGTDYLSTLAIDV